MINTQAQYQVQVEFFVPEYFNMVFLEIPLSAN